MTKYFTEFLPQHTYETRHFRFISPPARFEICKSTPIFKLILLFNALPQYLALHTAYTTIIIFYLMPAVTVNTKTNHIMLFSYYTASVINR